MFGKDSLSIERYAYDLGKEHGLVEGYKRFCETAGVSAAMGIVIAFGGVLITMYMVILIVGKIATTATSGSMGLNSNWSTTVIQMDTAASGAVGMANILPIAIIGIGILALIIGSLMRT